MEASEASVSQIAIKFPSARNFSNYRAEAYVRGEGILISEASLFILSKKYMD